MSKESAPVDFGDPANKYLMRRLLFSFDDRWEYTKYWAEQEGEFCMVMQDKLSEKYFDYTDHGASDEGSAVEISLLDGLKTEFILEQNVVFGPKLHIENHIHIAPFGDQYFVPGLTWGIHYGPDGKMDPVRNVKGLPKKIDMKATAKAFIEQVIEGDFARPQLIRPGK